MIEHSNYHYNYNYNYNPTNNQNRVKKSGANFNGEYYKRVLLLTILFCCCVFVNIIIIIIILFIVVTYKAHRQWPLENAMDSLFGKHDSFSFVRMPAMNEI